MQEHKPLRMLVADLIDQVNQLVRQEIRLAQAEGSEKVAEASQGALSIAGGLLIALVALIVLVQALVVALANYMPPAVAALVVGVVLALIAIVLVRHGQNQLNLRNLTLPKTRASLQADSQVIMEATK
jgi:hypothetical protein